MPVIQLCVRGTLALERGLSDFLVEELLHVGQAGLHGAHAGGLGTGAAVHGPSGQRLAVRAGEGGGERRGEVAVAGGVAGGLRLKQAQQHDLLKFGIIPELIGRLPVIAPLTSLKREDLVRILTEPKNAMTKQYEALMAYDGVELVYEKDALEAVADKAIEMKIGARGLRSVMEGIMTDIMYTVPSEQDIEKVIVTADCVKNGTGPDVIRK